VSGEFNHTGDGACLDLLALDDSEKPDDGTLLLPLDGGGQPGQSEEASAKVQPSQVQALTQRKKTEASHT